MKIVLIENVETEEVCLNIDSEIILSNIDFQQRQNSNVSMRIMIISLIVRDIDTNQHQINKYIINNMYFVDEKNDKFVKIMIRREIHLMNDFKINMLINNDVIDFEK